MFATNYHSYMILEIVKRFVSPEEILFVTSNVDSKNTSDIDIYCITTGKSSAHLFYNESKVWIELFIDNLSDVHKKIENFDEIAINFIREMDFIYGDKDLFVELRAKTEQYALNYKIPEKRKNIIKYRIKVLLSKYLNPDKESTEIQSKFILNSLTYPLIQLILEHYNIFPSSPKRWILQLKSKVTEEEFNRVSKFINGELDCKLLLNMYSEYVGDVSAIDLDKSQNNHITFIS